MEGLPSQTFIADEGGMLHDSEFYNPIPVEEEPLEEMTAYVLEVDTTNGLRNTFSVEDDDQPAGCQYYHCKGGKVWIITRTPTAIFEYFGDAIQSIEKLGPAYHLDL